jgi:hypothetical protein
MGEIVHTPAVRGYARFRPSVAFGASLGSADQKMAKIRRESMQFMRRNEFARQVHNATPLQYRAQNID